MSSAKSSAPSLTAFRQQQLKAWQPILTPQTVIITFLVVGIVFLPIGIGLFLTSQDVVEQEIRYDMCNVTDDDAKCAPANPTDFACQTPRTVSFTIEESMKAPIFVYYKLTNYYQNHRRYVRSRSHAQLRGDEIDTTELDLCDPVEKDDSSSSSPTLPSPPGPSSPPSPSVPSPPVNEKRSWFHPCGLVAKSVFNDSLSLSLDSSSSSSSSLCCSSQQRSNIAWASDREEKFKNPNHTDAQYRETGPPSARLNTIVDTDSGEQSRAIPSSLSSAERFPGFIENEAFIVWMRTAALPTFRKLYARIDADDLRARTGAAADSDTLAAGTRLTLSINDCYPVCCFDGTKSLVLSTMSWAGGKNDFLGIAYLTVGSVSLALALIFGIAHKVKPRALGDVSYLNWNQ